MKSNGLKSLKVFLNFFGAAILALTIPFMAKVLVEGWFWIIFGCADFLNVDSQLLTQKQGVKCRFMGVCLPLRPRHKRRDLGEYP
jgi:hypothetical protein